MIGRLGCALCVLLLVPFVALAIEDYGLRLTVTARPRIVFGGQDVRVECRVPRIRTYRAVSWGLDCAEFYRASQEALPGRVIYETVTTVPRRECGPCAAFCVVDQHDRLQRVAATPQHILVIGHNCPNEVEGERP